VGVARPTPDLAVRRGPARFGTDIEHWWEADHTRMGRPQGSAVPGASERDHPGRFPIPGAGPRTLEWFKKNVASDGEAAHFGDFRASTWGWSTKAAMRLPTVAEVVDRQRW